MWKWWFSDYKKHFCTAEGELFSWNLVLHQVCQFLHYFPELPQLSYCQKSQRPKTCCHLQMLKLLPRNSQFLHFTSLLKHPIWDSLRTVNVDPDTILNEVDDADLKEKMRSCQHFFVDSRVKQVGHKVFNYAEKPRAAKVDGQFDHFFNNLKCAAFGTLVKDTEDGGFR